MNGVRWARLMCLVYRFRVSELLIERECVSKQAQRTVAPSGQSVSMNANELMDARTTFLHILGHDFILDLILCY